MFASGKNWNHRITNSHCFVQDPEDRSNAYQLLSTNFIRKTPDKLRFGMVVEDSQLLSRMVDSLLEWIGDQPHDIYSDVKYRRRCLTNICEGAGVTPEDVSHLIFSKYSSLVNPKNLM